MSEGALPVHDRNKYGEGGEAVGTEPGESGDFDTEAEARHALRHAAMHGKSHDGRSHEAVSKAVHKQFPHINRDTHSASIHGGSGTPEARSRLAEVAPKVIPENMPGEQPQESEATMGGTDASEDGDEGFTDV